MHALGSVRQTGLRATVAACGISAWHCDPIACAQDPGQASPGITPWERECRAPAPRITGSLSRAGLGPGSKPPSEQGSQAAQPQLTPAHSTAALRVVLPSAALQGAVPAPWVWGATAAQLCSPCWGPRYLHFPVCHLHPWHFHGEPGCSPPPPAPAKSTNVSSVLPAPAAMGVVPSLAPPPAVPAPVWR